MSVRPLSAASDRVLRQSAQPVEVFGDEIRQLVEDLIETMYAHEGVGLAAPQVGIGRQVCVANPSQRPGQEWVIINPVLQESGGRTATVEGCLSLPKTWGRVKRAARVRVSGYDQRGRPIEVAADGLLAIVLQHELDHLHGHLFLDRLPWWHRHRLFGRRACA